MGSVCNSGVYPNMSGIADYIIIIAKIIKIKPTIFMDI